ncbi:hypothetical protein ES708_33666 [subsurface metagenome]
MILGNSKNIERDITEHASKLSRPYIKWADRIKKEREENQ